MYPLPVLFVGFFFDTLFPIRPVNLDSGALLLVRLLTHIGNDGVLSVPGFLCDQIALTKEQRLVEQLIRLTLDSIGLPSAG